MTWNAGDSRQEMVSNETVSVIIPTYHRNDRLREAIESVRAQTYEPIELLVVDDSGTGHARAVVDDYPDIVYVAKETNEGTMAAWHTGFERATGTYVQVLDDDDALYEEKIAKQVRLMESNANVGAVYCGMEWEFDVVVLPDPALRGDVLEQVLTLDTSPCVTSTILIDGAILEEILPLPSYAGAIDDVLKIELAQVTEFDFVDEPLIRRGEIEGSISNSMKPVEARRRILREYADLYTRFPPEVRGTAVSSTYISEGYVHLSKNQWSLSAIRSFALGNYHAPSLDLRDVAVLGLSLFGRPGVRIGDAAARAVSKRIS